MKTVESRVPGVSRTGLGQAVDIQSTMPTPIRVTLLLLAVLKLIPTWP